MAAWNSKQGVVLLGHILGKFSTGPHVRPTLSSIFSLAPVQLPFHESSQRAHGMGVSWTPKSRVYSSLKALVSLQMSMLNGLTVLRTLCKWERDPPIKHLLSSIPVTKAQHLDGASESTLQLHSSRHKPFLCKSRHSKNLLLANEENPRSQLASWRATAALTIRQEPL